MIHSVFQIKLWKIKDIFRLINLKLKIYFCVRRGAIVLSTLHFNILLTGMKYLKWIFFLPQENCFIICFLMIDKVYKSRFFFFNYIMLYSQRCQVFRFVHNYYACAANITVLRAAVKNYRFLIFKFFSIILILI